MLTCPLKTSTSTYFSLHSMTSQYFLLNFLGQWFMLIHLSIRKAQLHSSIPLYNDRCTMTHVCNQKKGKFWGHCFSACLTLVSISVDCYKILRVWLFLIWRLTSWWVFCFEKENWPVFLMYACCSGAISTGEETSSTSVLLPNYQG